MGLTPGSKLGPYEIVSPLGAGGMGEVYRARDTRLDRAVAIKILPGHLSSNPEAKQRLDREARAISALSHPNVCHLYDVGQQDGVSVMEYLEGETLGNRLRRSKLPLEQVFRVGVEICQGLEHAHRSGVVHRDLEAGQHHADQVGRKANGLRLGQGARGSIGELGCLEHAGYHVAAVDHCGADGSGRLAVTGNRRGTDGTGQHLVFGLISNFPHRTSVASPRLSPDTLHQLPAIESTV
jgi:Protein kinase domain